MRDSSQSGYFLGNLQSKILHLPTKRPFSTLSPATHTPSHPTSHIPHPTLITYPPPTTTSPRVWSEDNDVLSPLPSASSPGAYHSTPLYPTPPPTHLYWLGSGVRTVMFCSSSLSLLSRSRSKVLRVRRSVRAAIHSIFSILEMA